MTGLPGPGHAFCGSMDDLEHDAMAAHALLQAMDEAQKDWDAYAEPAPDTIKQRAAEILAGWLGEEVAK